MDIFEIVQSFAKSRSCTFGICDASSLDTMHLKKSAFVPFVSRDIRKRTDPAVILPGVRSVIVVGVGWSGDLSVQNIISPCRSGNLPPEYISHQNGRQVAAPTDYNGAQLSSLGTNDDYHIRVKSLLREMADELSQHISFKYKILVDSSTLDERAFALRAGIGFFGRNGLIISPQFGTQFNIGLLLTDIPPVTTSLPSKTECPPHCRLCIDACPNSALQPDSPLDAAKCISYLTQKRDLSDEETIMLHNQLYGCDICQDVCPFNTPRAKTLIDPQEWLTMSDAAFAEKYAHTAMLWQGMELLRRNAQAVWKF